MVACPCPVQGRPSVTSALLVAPRREKLLPRVISRHAERICPHVFTFAAEVECLGMDSNGREVLIHTCPQRPSARGVSTNILVVIVGSRTYFNYAAPFRLAMRR